MDRLAKKCVIASGIMHGTLVVLLLVGPAFLGSNDTTLDPKEIIDFIPFKTLEQSVSGGGNPNVEQQAAPPIIQQPQAQQQQSPPPQHRQETPGRRQETRQAEPVKDEPKAEETGWKPSDKIKVNLKQTTRGSTDRNVKSASPTARDNSQSKNIASAINNIRSGASGSVKIDEFRGPGGGGVPYAGFNQALISSYMRAWLVPGDAVDSVAKVVAVITLKNDGTVISARIERRSGNAELDQSVQRALDKVSYVAPFPEGSKESQKTFWLEFDPKAKRMVG